MPTSQNGYAANDRSLVSSQPIPGTNVSVTVRNGDPGFLLTDFAAWFDAHVEDIDNARGHLDDWGYAERNVRGSSTTLSNHASGTAIDLNATRHPLGRRGTFTKAQVAAIHGQLRTYQGCIRWGGDYSGRPDEMHFEINASPAACTQVADRLRATEGDDMPTPKEVWHELIGEKVVGKKGVHADAAIATTYVKVQKLEDDVAELKHMLQTLIAKKG